MFGIVPDGHCFALADSAENPFRSVAARCVNADAGVPEVASVALGSPVVIQVFSETEQDFHLHGFDIDLMGDDVTFDFVADKLGDFELESHESGEILLTLSVVED